MEVILKKWGNSLGFRLPKLMADEVGLFEGKKVNVISEKGKIIINPVNDAEYNLEEMMSMVTDDNFHEEIVTYPIGKEVW